MPTWKFKARTGQPWSRTATCLIDCVKLCAPLQEHKWQQFAAHVLWNFLLQVVFGLPLQVGKLEFGSFKPTGSSTGCAVGATPRGYFKVSNAIFCILVNTPAALTLVCCLRACLLDVTSRRAAVVTCNSSLHRCTHLQEAERRTSAGKQQTATFSTPTDTIRTSAARCAQQAYTPIASQLPCQVGLRCMHIVRTSYVSLATNLHARL